MHKTQLKRSWWISKWYPANSEMFDLMFETCSASGLIRPLWPNLLATELTERATQQLRDSGAPEHCLQQEGDRRCFRCTLGVGAAGPHSLLAEFGPIGHILDTWVVFAKGVPTM